MSLLSLPHELRQLILSYTPLSGPFTPHSRSDSRGILIRSYKYAQDPSSTHFSTSYLLRPCCGSCGPQRSYCSCAPYNRSMTNKCTCPAVPISLFLVCKTLNADAVYVVYSSNRFTLSPDRCGVGAYLDFLRCLPREGVRALTRLDLRVDYEFVRRFYCDKGKGKKEGGARKEWAELMVFIVRNCTLEGLHLCLDSGFYRDEVDREERAGDDGDLQWLQMTYRDLVKGLNEMRGRLKRFHCFFSCWHEREKAAEFWVIGRVSKGVGKDKEDVVKREGKVGWRRREEEWVHWDCRWDGEEGDNVKEAMKESGEAEGEEAEKEVQSEGRIDDVDWEDEGSQYWNSDMDEDE